MAGRAALLVILLVVTTCAWASPINRDDLESSNIDALQSTQPSVGVVEEKEEEYPVTEAPDSSKRGTVAPAPVEAAEKVAVAAEKVKEEESPVIEAADSSNWENDALGLVEDAVKVAVAAEEEAEESSPVTEAKVSSKQESVASAVEEGSTVVEKADALIASEKVPEQSEILINEEDENVPSGPIDEAIAVEKASPSQIAEEATTVSPAAEEVIIAERVPSEQESDVPETTEKIEIEVDSVIQKEPESQKEAEVSQNAASIVEKSFDREASQGEEEQSSVTEVIPAEVVDESIAVEKIAEADVAAVVEEEIVVSEAEVEVTTVIAEGDQEAVERGRMGEDVIEVTTSIDVAVDREDATEEPFDTIAEESSDVEVVTAVAVESEDGSFRQGDVDITEAPEEEDISSTTVIPQSEQDIDDAKIRVEEVATDEPSTDSPIDRMDSVTDIVYVDENTEQPEELIQAESIVREEIVEAEAVTDAPEAEVAESASIDMQDEGSQDITTEGSVQEITEMASSQTFDDAAPIKVVEIKESIEPVESVVSEDSAPIEIVEITESSQPLAMDAAEETAPAADERESSASESEIAQTTEIIPDQREEATTIAVESPAIRDEQKLPSGSEQDQEAEDAEEKPNASKIQPAQIGDDYWRTMVSEENPSTQPSVLPTELSEISEEVPVEAIKEAEDVNINIREGDSVPSADVAQQSSVDDEIAKVAQKYGLQSVGKVGSEEKPVDEVASDSEVVSNVDVPKEDSIYLGNESKRSDFQESNDLTRRLSFGDKVVRFARSYL